MPKVIDLPTSTSMSDSDYLIMEASGGGTKKITKNNALTPVKIEQGGTGGTSFASARSNLGIVHIQLPSGTAKTFSFTTAFRGFLLLSGVGSNGVGIYSVACTGTGTVILLPIVAASGLTSSVASYRLTITMSTGVDALLINGGVGDTPTIA